ncbi:SDR family NAD(P)-dependent oxidoreductase, partial [Corynebacterium dentalis]|uniref:SDR family NAD(P)-dependent oxidoreductase n=1 Tax=Corynebacterium dentalis TaxID=2014528 RepID=UPI00289FD294
SLIAISSVSGREVDFASGPYGTVKTALIGYMSGLAFQLAGRGIRANTVSPGNTYHDGGVWQSLESGNPEMFKSSLELNPTNRMGTPQEVADVVVFVSSPRASRMTGANVLVDGGLSRGIQF